MSVQASQAASGIPSQTNTEQTDSADQKRLTGARRNLAQFVWVMFALLNFAAYLSGLGRVYTIATTLSPATVTQLAAIGLPPNAPAIYLLILNTLTLSIFGGVAVLIFRRRSDDPMALLASTMLIFTAMLYTVPGYEARVPLFIVAMGITLGELSQIAFILTFPDGRFYPRWSWLLLLPLFVWRILIWYLVYLPDYYGTEHTGERYPFMRQNTLEVALFMCVFLFALAMQIKRYRRISNPMQRQQTKWLVWGMTMAVILVGGYSLAVSSLGFLQATDVNAIFMRLVGRTISQAALWLIPITMMYAILRYNLWGIDFLINRTLVYVPLTTILAGLYSATMTVTQSFFIAATGERSDAAIVFTTLLLTAVFMPIKDELQKFVDRHLKEAPNPIKNLNIFDQRVRSVADVLDANQVLRLTLFEAVQAFDAHGGAIFVAIDEQPRLLHITEHWHGPIAYQLPIVDAQTVIGWLALGERPKQLGYSTKERRALKQVLHNVGHVVFLLGGIKEPLSAQSVDPIPPVDITKPLAADVILPLPTLVEENQVKEY